MMNFFFFFQAEDGIRDGHVTGVQTCALPICGGSGTRGGSPRSCRSAARRSRPAGSRGSTPGAPLARSLVREEYCADRMVVQAAGERVHALAALQALADAARAAAGDPGAALDAYADALARACGADAAIVRTIDGASLVARAVAASSPAIAAQLEGSRIPAEQLDDPEAPPAPPFAHAATLRIPVEIDGALAGAVEIMRSGPPFDDEERLLAQVIAHGVTLALRAREAARRGSARSDDPLVLAGEALAAGVDEERAPALSAARVALDSREFATSERIGGAVVVGVRLGEPGVLQLVFADEPSGGALAGIATFALRAASALRNAAHARDAALELAGARALLAVLGQATADLSLEHTLATALERTAELLGIDRVAVYLRDDGRQGAPSSGRTRSSPTSCSASCSARTAGGASWPSTWPATRRSPACRSPPRRPASPRRSRCRSSPGAGT